MAKYDSQLQDFPNLLASAKSVLICLPTNLSSDKLASSLALALAIRKTGKQAVVITETQPLVSNANLYGVGEVKTSVPTGGEGNFVITLEGVVDPSGQLQTVPALEKLDWYPENGNLNLVFHIVPGQRFEPKSVTSKYEGSRVDLVIVMGAANLIDLGSIYSNNSASFANSPVINIDNNPVNSNFGKINIIDGEASSLSEMVAHLLGGLNLTIDSDIATNIITGLYEETANLTQKVSADTFAAASLAMQNGARLPQVVPAQPQSQPIVQQSQPQPAIQFQAEQPQVIPQSEVVTPQPSVPVEQPVVTPVSSDISSSPWLSAEPQIQFSTSAINSVPETVTQPQVTSQPQPVIPEKPVVPQASIAEAQSSISGFQSQSDAQGVDLRQIFQLPQMPSQAVTVSGSEHSEEQNKVVPQPVSSPEEKPVGEYVTSHNPEMDSSPTPDWLVPKIFKGGNLG